jgi:PAS domain S-box-containing protein
MPSQPSRTSVPASGTGDSAAAGVSEQEVQVGAAQLLALLDSTTAVIYMRSVAGRYLFVNAEYERLFDVHRDDVIGCTDHEIFPAHIADQFRANDLEALSNVGPVQMVESARSPGGVRHYVTVKSPLVDAHGAPYAICGISTDITERENAQDEVTALNAELERRLHGRTAELETTATRLEATTTALEASAVELRALVVSVSHDLQAPLRSLHSYSEILLEQSPDRDRDDTGLADLRRMQANAVRMQQIIDDLLSLSHASRTELHREEST